MTDYPMLTASLDQRYAGLSRQGLTELVEDLSSYNSVEDGFPNSE